MQGCGGNVFLKCIFLKCLYPKCIFAKCIRLACLLSFASLFVLGGLHILISSLGKTILFWPKAFHLFWSERQSQLSRVIYYTTRTLVEFKRQNTSSEETFSLFCQKLNTFSEHWIFVGWIGSSWILNFFAPGRSKISNPWCLLKRSKYPMGPNIECK